MLAELVKCLALLPRSARWQWAGLIPLAIATAAAEAVGATAVFMLIKIVSDAARASELPLVPAILAMLPWRDPQAVVLSFAALVAGFYLLKNGLLTVVEYARSKVVGDAIAGLSRTMLQGYLTAPYAFHFRRNSTELIRNMDHSVNVVFRTVMSAAVNVISEVFVVLGIAAVLLITAPVVTMVAGATLAGMSTVLLRLMRRASMQLGAQVHELGRELLQSLQQALGALKEVKVLGRERFFYDAFSRGQGALVRSRCLHATLSVVPRLVVETAFVCSTFFVIVLVTLRGNASADIVPLLGLYAYAGFRVIPSVNRIVWQLSEIRYGTTAIDQIYDDFMAVAGNASETFSRPQNSRLGFADRVVLDHIAYIYDGTNTPVLQDVNVVIRRGESIGIVGPTGSGKSTLVDILVGLLPPSSGRVTIDRIDMRLRLPAWQRQVGYVPQSIFLTDDSLRRNIALGIPDAHIDAQKISIAVEMAQLSDLVASLPGGLDTFVGERGIRLSGGERQRVGIARALYHEPAVLIFDEATSALDNRTEAEVTRAIEALRGKKTLIIVAHRLSTVRRCDRLVFLLNGRVAGCGSFEQLIESNAAFRAMALLAETDEAGPES